MAAVHPFDMAYVPGEARPAAAWLPWIKDAGAAIGLVFFIGSCFVLSDALLGLFS
jgi:hypothetical protein